MLETMTLSDYMDTTLMLAKVAIDQGDFSDCTHFIEAFTLMLDSDYILCLDFEGDEELSEYQYAFIQTGLNKEEFAEIEEYYEEEYAHYFPTFYHLMPSAKDHYIREYCVIKLKDEIKEYWENNK